MKLSGLFAEAVFEAVIAQLSSALFDERVLGKVLVMVWVEGIDSLAHFLLFGRRSFHSWLCHFVF